MWLIKKVLFYPLRGHQASNIRLTLCPSCSSFADPFVEHPPLLLFLDLVLLKPGVYRHVLFNRGHEPVQAGRNVDEDKLRGKSEGRERTVDRLLVTLFLSTILVESYLTWNRIERQSPSSTPLASLETFGKALFRHTIETIVYHSTLLASAFLLLRFTSSPAHVSQPFSLRLVPLSLLLSSLPKLTLLLLLSIYPSTRSSSSVPSSSSFLQPLIAEHVPALAFELSSREWIIEHLLGGMGSGFALRILFGNSGVLPGVMSSGLVLVGWAVNGAVKVWLGG